MGAMSEILPQGPMRHCGAAEPHGKHHVHPTTEPFAWCDGVPPLESFVELMVRVPLGKTGIRISWEEMSDMGHAGVYRWIKDEGLGTFIFDEMGEPATRAALRLRVCGEDKVYPLEKGQLPDAEQRA